MNSAVGYLKKLLYFEILFLPRFHPKSALYNLLLITHSPVWSYAALSYRYISNIILVTPTFWGLNSLVVNYQQKCGGGGSVYPAQFGTVLIILFNLQVFMQFANVIACANKHCTIWLIFTTCKFW